MAASQDLVIPAFVGLDQAGTSPLLGFPPKERTLLAFFRGDVGERRLPNYSRGLRQKLHRLAQEQGWAARHGIHIGDRDVPNDMSYPQLLSSSVFCPVLPGERWQTAMCPPLLMTAWCCGHKGTVRSEHRASRCLRSGQAAADSSWLCPALQQQQRLAHPWGYLAGAPP